MGLTHLFTTQGRERLLFDSKDEETFLKECHPREIGLPQEIVRDLIWAFGLALLKSVAGI